MGLGRIKRDVRPRRVPQTAPNGTSKRPKTPLQELREQKKGGSKRTFLIY
nr:MAG TPA: hypothetical protein [Caudoviricetes sp.]